MENLEFQNRIRLWLEGKDPVPAAFWSLNESTEPGSVNVDVSVKETVIVGNIVFSTIINGKCTTEDSESAIHNAVLALNDELLKRL